MHVHARLSGQAPEQWAINDMLRFLKCDVDESNGPAQLVFTLSREFKNHLLNEGCKPSC